MKKRILSILLAFAMIFTLMPTAFAVATTTYQVVTVDKTTVKQGETVTVKVEGEDEEAAAAAIQQFLTENV